MKNLNELGQTEQEFLIEYKKKIAKYEKPSVTVDMLIFSTENKKHKNARFAIEKELKLLLIKRKDHPFMNTWALPGGFVGINESMETAAYRELEEETGINIDKSYLEQLYTFGEVNRDPRMRVISGAYIALIPREDLNVKAGDDALEAEWFNIKRTNHSINPITKEKNYFIELENEKTNEKIVYKTNIKKSGINKIIPTEEKTYELVSTEKELAFDHVKVIDMALDRLKNKVEYTSIAFTLLPEKFTLTELQSIYELILEKPLHKSNFRRKIEDMVIETKEIATDKKSKLFTFDTSWNYEF